MRQRCYLLLAALCACRAAPPPPPAPVVITAPVSPWTGVLAQAARAADQGRFEVADSLLAAFSRANPGTADGLESDFWRAVFKADPTNRQTTTRQALSALDGYLGAGPEAPRYNEAMIFRRLLEATDSARAQIAAVRAAADAKERARDDDVKRLSDDLERTLAELERIRRRLSPKPEVVPAPIKKP